YFAQLGTRSSWRQRPVSSVADRTQNLARQRESLFAVLSEGYEPEDKPLLLGQLHLVVLDTLADYARARGNELIANIEGDPFQCVWGDARTLRLLVFNFGLHALRRARDFEVVLSLGSVVNADRARLALYASGVREWNFVEADAERHREGWRGTFGSFG